MTNAFEQDLSLLDSLKRHAVTIPNKVALLWYGAEISYESLNQLSDRCANLLLNVGIKKGDRVGIYMENCPQFFIAYFGIQKIGAVVCPFSPLLKQIELEKQIFDLDVRLIICSDDLLPIANRAKDNTSLELIFLINYQDFSTSQPTYAIPRRKQNERATIADEIDFISQVNQQSATFCIQPFSEHDVALMLYTSGTTGSPKGAMLTYKNIFFKVQASAHFGEIRPDDIHLAASPLCHVSGLLYGLSIPIYLGSTVVLHSFFSATSVLESIAAHKVTYWKGSAPMLVEILNNFKPGQYDLSSLRMTTAASFGVPLTKELADKWLMFTGNSLCSETGYGMSETHTNDTMMPPNQIKYGSYGKPLPGVNCRIVNRETGEDLPPGSEGEIVLNSPANFLGYWGQSEMTGKILRDGWLYTGDMGKMDDEGFLIFLGRYKQLIKISGYSVFPSEIEHILLKHPKVSEVAVIEVQDSESQPFIKACIVLKDEWKSSVSKTELLSWCSQNMTIYKVPRVIEFCETLPKSSSGKVLHRLLQ